MATEVRLERKRVSQESFNYSGIRKNIYIRSLLLGYTQISIGILGLFMKDGNLDLYVKSPKI